MAFENIIAWGIPSKAASASSAQTYAGNLLFIQWSIMSWVNAAVLMLCLCCKQNQIEDNEICVPHIL